MGKITETRTVRIRYPKLSEAIKDNEKFGWVLDSKVLLNRFGNPLPLGERVDEDDLREKCFYDLHFKRQVDEEVVMKLTSLQAEFDATPLLDNSFGRGRIAGCVWISIASLAFIIASITSISRNASIALILFLVGIAIGSPISVIFATGCVKVARVNNQNAEIKKHRDEIANEAQSIVNSNKE